MGLDIVVVKNGVSSPVSPHKASHENGGQDEISVAGLSGLLVTPQTPAAHDQDWSTITGKPATYPPSAHNQDWSTITGKPSTYPPSGHTQAWTTITSRPGYMYVSLGTQINAASFYGVNISTFGATGYNITSQLSGVPAAAKGLVLRMLARDTGAVAGGAEYVFGIGSTSQIIGGSWSYCRCLLNYRWYDINVVLPISVYNTFYLRADASGAGTMNVYMTCTGYFVE